MNMAVEKLLPWAALPLLLVLAVTLHVTMVQADIPLQPSTYAPVLLATALVTLFEIRLPHRSLPLHPTPIGAYLQLSVALAPGASFSGETVLAQHGALSSHRESA